MLSFIMCSRGFGRRYDGSSMCIRAVCGRSFACYTVQSAWVGDIRAALAVEGRYSTIGVGTSGCSTCRHSFISVLT